MHKDFRHYVLSVTCSGKPCLVSQSVSWCTVITCNIALPFPDKLHRVVVVVVLLLLLSCLCCVLLVDSSNLISGHEFLAFPTKVAQERRPEGKQGAALEEDEVEQQQEELPTTTHSISPQSLPPLAFFELLPQFS
jgi:hypothetical protein